MLSNLRLLAFFSLLFCACGVSPRFPADVSRALNRDKMLVHRSEHVDLYYPKGYEQEAKLLAERAEGCVMALRARTTAKTGISQKRVELIFPDLPFNNAYALQPGGGDFYSMIPTHWTMDLMSETGIFADPGHLACHELTHYTQSQQTFRTWSGLNKAFGWLFTPQAGLDSWFWEGLATFYEQQLQPGFGRLAWPAWEGMFHAAVVAKRVDGGDLSEFNRRLHWGHDYAYGSHFITFLVERYGELRLWKLIQRQGSSFFFPFIVNQRFKREYGKTLSSLIDEFREWTQERYPARERPATQRVLREVGMTGRYARANDGSEAVISEAMDVPPTLTVYRPDGSVRYTRRLVEVFPRRKLATPDAVAITGLRFSRDSQHLYFVAVDLGAVFQRARLLELDLTREQLLMVERNLAGLGGDISPDGKHYLYVKVTGHGHALARYDLATGQTTEILKAPPTAFFSSPTYSADGSQIVVSVFDEAYGLWVVGADGTRLHTLNVATGPVYDATFVDAEHILFLGPHERRFQVFLYDLTAKKATRVTDAPYLALFPRAQNGNVRFFNRDGFGYTLDEVPLPVTLHAYNFATRTLADVADAGAPPVEVEPSGVPLAPDALSEPAAPPPVATEQAGVVDFTGVVDSNVPPPTQGDLSVSLDQPLKLPTPATLPAPGHEGEATVFPRLLIPSVRVPAFSLPNGGGGFAGVYIGGTDVLGKHRWGASLGAQVGVGRLSGSIGYLNTQLSPLWLALDMSQLSIDQLTAKTREHQPTVLFHDRHRQRDITFTALLPLRTTVLALQLHATENRQPDRTEVEHHRFLSGGTLSLSHDAMERTRMLGNRRGYTAGFALSYYPESLGSLRSDLADLSGSLNMATPLPFSKRHRLSLGLRARGILSGEPSRLLEVGGNQFVLMANRPAEPTLDPYPGLPPTRRFQEPLRGFETYPFTSDQIYIANLNYFMPIIIDRGTATSLSILPSYFLRQIELEAFATVAATNLRVDKDNLHSAIGAAIGVRNVWWAFDFTLRYQLSLRLTDDDKVQHLIGLVANF